MTDFYEIKIKGHLDATWSDWFQNMKVTQLEGDKTLLSGFLIDQASLHGLLDRIRDLNLELLSVTQINSQKYGVKRINKKWNRRNA